MSGTDTNSRVARRALATTKEVAEYLGVAVPTIHQWRWLGVGPRAVRVRGQLRFNWGDVDAWLELQAGRDGGAGHAA